MSLFDFSMFLGLGICIALVAADFLSWVGAHIDRALDDFIDGGTD